MARQVFLWNVETLRVEALGREIVKMFQVFCHLMNTARWPTLVGSYSHTILRSLKKRERFQMRLEPLFQSERSCSCPQMAIPSVPRVNLPTELLLLGYIFSSKSRPSNDTRCRPGKSGFGDASTHTSPCCSTDTIYITEELPRLQKPVARRSSDDFEYFNPRDPVVCSCTRSASLRRDDIRHSSGLLHTSQAICAMLFRRAKRVEERSHALIEDIDFRYRYL